MEEGGTLFGGGKRHSLRWKKEALASMKEEALSSVDPLQCRRMTVQIQILPSEEAPTLSSGLGPEGRGSAPLNKEFRRGSTKWILRSGFS